MNHKCRKLKTEVEHQDETLSCYSHQFLLQQYIPVTLEHDLFSSNMGFRESASCHHTFFSDFCQAQGKVDLHTYTHSHMLVFCMSSHGVLKGHCFQEVIQFDLCVPAPYSASQDIKPSKDSSASFISISLHVLSKGLSFFPLGK